MSEHTTRIVDLPENISIQMPPSSHTGGGGVGNTGLMSMSSAAQHPTLGLPSTNTRTDYDPQNPTYTPINAHPNPYGNTVQPNVMPLPQPKYQSTPSLPPQHTMMDIDTGTIDPLAELRTMAPVRLPSRDIPMDQLQYQQDEEIQPNYIPKPKLTKDYVREYEEAAEKSAKKHEKSKRQAEQIEDAMTDFQLPVMVALLFFVFQVPIVHSIMYKYMGIMPFFHSDGNLNFYGILFKSLMFGSVFWGLQRLIHIIS